MSCFWISNWTVGYPKSLHYYCEDDLLHQPLCPTSTPFPPALPATGITSTTWTHLHQATHQWHRGFPPEVRTIDIEMCHSIAGQCHNGTRPIVLPLTNHAHQQVDVVGSFLSASSVAKGVGWKSDEMMKWDLTLHSFCTSKTGETMQKCLVMRGPEAKHWYARIIFQPLMGRKKQCQFMCAEGIDVAENKGRQSI